MSVVSFSALLTSLATALVVAVVVAVVVHVVVRLLARRWSWATALGRHTRVPFRLLLVLIALSSVAGSIRPEPVDPAAWRVVTLVLRLADIGVGAWLLGSVLVFLEDLGLNRYRTDTRDDRTARRARTQVLILRRLTVAVVVVVAIGAALLSFPGVRALGASLLASAGLISVVAAVAAQSTLANLFAGVQIAFSDALRLEDAVVVQQQFGRVEEITLSYVVVRLWDDRRLVLPSTYFVSNPFENWTRQHSELVGAVELDLDWRVDVDGLRVELDRLLAATELWDRRSSSLQVTDAVGGVVRVRAMVSAVDAPTLFDLRCLVREGLVGWLQGTAPLGLPRQRVDLTPAATTSPATVQEAG